MVVDSRITIANKIRKLLKSDEKNSFWFSKNELNLIYCKLNIQKNIIKNLEKKMKGVLQTIEDSEEKNIKIIML